MKHLPLLLFSIFINSCSNQTQNPVTISEANILQDTKQDSTFYVEIIREINDSSITNNTDKTIDILFNGINNYLGGHKNPKLNFATECMMCEPVQVYQQGFLFGKKLYVTKDTVIIYEKDRNISDTTGLIKMKNYYGERRPKKYKLSNSSLMMKFQGQSCTDADFVSVSLCYGKDTINFNKLINASLFEYDLNNDGIEEQYLLGSRNCSQELVLLRVNDNSK